MDCQDIDRAILLTTLGCQFIVFFKLLFILYVNYCNKGNTIKWQNELTKEVKKIQDQCSERK